MDAALERLIAELVLAPHPEGGFFRRIYESDITIEHNGHLRPALTAIRYLLPRGQVSRWHRVDADECWHWQDGDALELQVFDRDASRLSTIRLDRASAGGVAMHVVPAGHWQAARPLGAFTLVACTVSPGFVWEGFEMLGEDDKVAGVLHELGARI
ncbi:cupin domain-containing protein [Lysobacter sp. LF1]|uniref:Cupin domain-containing protein n=1 Tax=Lysobacter stagni TaxID=3045172 RepID=A0ABT6XKV6_9GAMM|nr:cupin domain-containing protein [Lysobacter sp. LF1]MDI9240709.1 cupin domain-containing protein [Lysobacter sp. LF1]